MRTHEILLLIISIVVLALVFFIQFLFNSFINKPARKARREFFLHRSTMDPAAWYEKYYAPLGISYKACIKVTNALARVLGCDHTQIFPSDRFDREFKVKQISVLGINDLDDEMDMFFDHELQELLGKTACAILEEQDPYPATVGDLIRCGEKYIA